MQKVILLGLVLTSFASIAASKVILDCNFDSVENITTPTVGPVGMCNGTRFEDGISGKAIYIAPRCSTVRFVLADGLPQRKGTFEFHAKLMSGKTSYGAYGDPNFFSIINDEGQRPCFMEFTSNNGTGSSGLCGAIANLYCITGSGSSYANVLGVGGENEWHKYTIRWDVEGFAEFEGKPLMVYMVDDNVVAETKGDSFDKNVFASEVSKACTLDFCYYDNSRGVSPFLLDNLKILDDDATSASGEPGTMSDVTVSSVTAHQHYPWCGKVDIGYSVSGHTEGLLVKIVVKDNTNGITYEAKTFNVNPTATVGTHSVIWDASADGVKKISYNMVATVSLIVPGK